MADRLAATGDSERLADSSTVSRLASGGDVDRLAASGDRARVATAVAALNLIDEATAAVIASPTDAGLTDTYRKRALKLLDHFG